ncbi:ATP-binding protein [Candidatus Peregrinibacteria bacterium]|nr:ATP-binding protein [Candidatus Peregrinibacteria bacterium]
MKTYTLTIPADLSLSSSVREISVRIFEEVGFESGDIFRLKLVLDELYMNAVKYGSVQESTLHITYEVEDRTLRVKIEDEGGEKKVSAEELKKIMEYQRANTDPSKSSGRGLAQITDGWADTFKVWDGKRGGLCIAFSKKILSASEKKNSRKKNASEAPQASLDIPLNIPLKTIAIMGEVDRVTLEEKSAPVNAYISQVSTPQILVLSLGDMTFCNSSFLAKLASWKQGMKAKKGDLVLENVRPEIWEIFELVGLLKVIFATKTKFSETGNFQKTEKE